MIPLLGTLQHKGPLGDDWLELQSGRTAQSFLET